MAGNRTFPQFRCDDSKKLLKNSSRLKGFLSLFSGMNTNNAHLSQMDASRASAESSSCDRLIFRCNDSKPLFRCDNSNIHT